jgi:hypothetical protein
VRGVAASAADDPGGRFDAFDTQDGLSARQPVLGGDSVFDADSGAALGADGDGVAVVAGDGAVIAVHEATSSVG